MWHEIINENDLASFMDGVYSFHDSCIKEIRYLSGAYVNEELSMHPMNNRRALWVIMQRQFENPSMIEMEFEGLKFLKLLPHDEGYTCEILGATMIIKDDCIYWCDSDGLAEADVDDYEGTIICSEKFRWRAINNYMGPKEFYAPSV